MKYVLLFMLGFCKIVLVVSYVYLNESVQGQHKVIVTTSILIGDAFSVIVASTFFALLSVHMLFIVQMIISPLFFISILFFEDSPNEPSTDPELKDAKHTIERIAWKNRAVMPKEYKLVKGEIDPEAEVNHGQGGYVDFLRNRKHMINLVSCILLFVIVYNSYNIINYYMKYVGGNIYMNNIIQCVFEILGLLFSSQL